MKNIRSGIAVVGVLVACAVPVPPCFGAGAETVKSPVKLFLLGGQSNMDGCGRAEELPVSYQAHPANVVTWDNREQCWVPLTEDSMAIARHRQFGPEVAFAHRIAKAYPDQTIAITKTSAGGTKLHTQWVPGKVMYQKFMRNFRSARAQLEEAGVACEVAGMLWMQGESDSGTVEMAEAYETNLKLLVADVRKQTGHADLPIVMGRISSSLLKTTPWNFDQARTVQAAQEAVAAEDVHVHIINTDALSTLKDNTHFDTEAQLTLGARMGGVMLRELAAPALHGKASAAKFDGRRLPYINNLVNRIIVANADCALPSEEVRRALAPYGTAVAPRGSSCLPRPARDVGDGYAAFMKPYPEAMDEWPQRLHGADNNCVARDTVVGPPRHVQWVSGPAWLRAHIGSPTVTSMVSSGGRLFSIEDAETAENPLLPARWRLVARDAFNGIVLWALDYPSWEQVTAHMAYYHAQMQSRLVAIGNTVYCTPGLTAPVTALDAATGRILREYEGTAGSQEFVYHEGRLYVIVGHRMHYSGYRPSGPQTVAGRSEAQPKTGGATVTFEGNGFPLSFYNPQTPNVENPACAIVAVDAATGREIWRGGNIVEYTGCSMGLKKNRLVYQCTQGVFCLDAQDGRQIWAARKEIPYGTGNKPHTVVLGDKAVYSEEGRGVFAYSLADGSDYWGKSIPARKAFAAPTDLLIAAGALWMCGACNDARGVVTSRPTAYDLRTGDRIKTIPQTLSKPMGHDRCYRNFITERFFINSKTGDIIVSDGTGYYSVFGHPVHRGQSWNPRGGYTLVAKTRAADEWTEKWRVKMPMTGKAMVLAGDAVFVVGAPLVFPADDLAGTYAGRRGAIMRAVATADGATLAEYKLDKLPVWDGLAAAYGRIFIVNQDGGVACWGR